MRSLTLLQIILLSLLLMPITASATNRSDGTIAQGQNVILDLLDETVVLENPFGLSEWESEVFSTSHFQTVILRVTASDPTYGAHCSLVWQWFEDEEYLDRVLPITRVSLLGGETMVSVSDVAGLRCKVVCKVTCRECSGSFNDVKVLLRK